MICKFTCPNGHVLQGLETQLGQSCICPQCGVTFVVQTISPAEAAAPITPVVSYPFSAMPLVAPAQAPPAAFPRPAPRRAAEPQMEAAEPAANAELPDFNADWRSEGFSFDGNGAASQEATDAGQAYDAADFTTPAAPDDSTDFLASVSDSRAGSFDPSTLEGLGEVAGGSDSDVELMAAAAHLPGPSAKQFYHIRCPKKHLLEVRGELLNTDMACPACGTLFRIRLDRTLEFRRKREQEIERHDAKQGQIWLSVAIAAGTIIVLAILAIMIMGNTGH